MSPDGRILLTLARGLMRAQLKLPSTSGRGSGSECKFCTNYLLLCAPSQKPGKRSEYGRVSSLVEGHVISQAEVLGGTVQTVIVRDFF